MALDALATFGESQLAPLLWPEFMVGRFGVSCFYTVGRLAKERICLAWFVFEFMDNRPDMNATFDRQLHVTN